MNKGLYDFYLKLALRFRLSLKQLCELLSRPSTNEEQDKLFKEFDDLYGTNFELRRAYIYLFHHEAIKDKLSSQGKNKFLAAIFASKYLKAVKSNDKEEINKLNEKLVEVDEEFNKLKRRSNGQPLSKEELLTVAKYRLKYAYSREDVSHILGINASGYRSAEEHINDINIKNKIQLINDYYMNINSNKKRQR